MKAYKLSVNDLFCAEVVFAETAGKAKALAACCDGIFDYYEFTDIRAIREPQLDKYYKEGKWRLDWYNSQDRIALVKEANFVCDPDYKDREECEYCPAKEYCDDYQDWLKELNGNG